MATNRFEPLRFPANLFTCRDCGAKFDGHDGYKDTTRFMASVCKCCADEAINARNFSPAPMSPAAA